MFRNVMEEQTYKLIYQPQADYNHTFLNDNENIKIQMFKCYKHKYFILDHNVLNFEFRSFEFFSCFGFRISEFPFYWNLEFYLIVCKNPLP
jgi:hypothetical protein